jgi:hypothetical protein
MTGKPEVEADGRSGATMILPAKGKEALRERNFAEGWPGGRIDTLEIIPGGGTRTNEKRLLSISG